MTLQERKKQQQQHQMLSHPPTHPLKKDVPTEKVTMTLKQVLTLAEEEAIIVTVIAISLAL